MRSTIWRELAKEKKKARDVKTEKVLTEAETRGKELVSRYSVSAGFCVPDCHAILGNISPCQPVTITKLKM